MWSGGGSRTARARVHTKRPAARWESKQGRNGLEGARQEGYLQGSDGSGDRCELLLDAGGSFCRLLLLLHRTSLPLLSHHSAPRLGFKRLIPSRGSIPGSPHPPLILLLWSRGAPREARWPQNGGTPGFAAAALSEQTVHTASPQNTTRIMPTDRPPRSSPLRQRSSSSFIVCEGRQGGRCRPRNKLLPVADILGTGFAARRFRTQLLDCIINL